MKKEGLNLKSIEVWLKSFIYSFRAVKPEDLKPKAKEAFGRSVIDMSVSLYKGLILLFTLTPLAFLLQAVFVSPAQTYSWSSFNAFLGSANGLIAMILYGFAGVLAELLRRRGVNLINEIEENARTNDESSALFEQKPKTPEIDPESYIGTMLFHPDAQDFFKIRGVKRYTKEEMGGAIILEATSLATNDPDRGFELEEVGDSLFVVPKDFQQDKIDEYLKRAAEREAADRAMLDIAKEIPSYRRDLELSQDIPF